MVKQEAYTKLVEGWRAYNLPRLHSLRAMIDHCDHIDRKTMFTNNQLLWPVVLKTKTITIGKGKDKRKVQTIVRDPATGIRVRLHTVGWSCLGVACLMKGPRNEPRYEQHECPISIEECYWCELKLERYARDDKK